MGGEQFRTEKRFCFTPTVFAWFGGCVLGWGIGRGSGGLRGKAGSDGFEASNHEDVLECGEQRHIVMCFQCIVALTIAGRLEGEVR